MIHGGDEVDIGSILKNAREGKGFTQEQIAEKLDVSRQTVSNWENSRSYPDIMKVIELSDIYSVSLDELIKGDEKIMNHLENTTNTVKRKARLIKTLELSTYFAVWLVGILFFYLFLPTGDEMAYSLIYMYFALPLISVIVSVFIGGDLDWGKSKWLMPVIFGSTIFLSGYLTFDVSNMFETGRAFAPDFMGNAFFFFLGSVPSYISMALSYAIAVQKEKKS